MTNNSFFISFIYFILLLILFFFFSNLHHHHHHQTTAHSNNNSSSSLLAGDFNTTSSPKHTTTRKLLLHESCTKRDISISQSRDMSSGIPQYIVQIVNTCVSGCAPSNIHLHCAWFASARLVNPKTFKRLAYDDCLVNGGKPLKTRQHSFGGVIFGATSILVWLMKRVNS